MQISFLVHSLWSADQIYIDLRLLKRSTVGVCLCGGGEEVITQPLFRIVICSCHHSIGLPSGGNELSCSMPSAEL